MSICSVKDIYTWVISIWKKAWSKNFPLTRRGTQQPLRIWKDWNGATQCPARWKGSQCSKGQGKKSKPRPVTELQICLQMKHQHATKKPQGASDTPKPRHGVIVPKLCCRETVSENVDLHRWLQWGCHLRNYTPWKEHSTRQEAYKSN